MGDLRSLSDADLLALRGKGAATSAPAGIASMSDEELLARRKAAGNETVARGSILPFSRNAAGDVSFDSNAGLVGIAKDVGRAAWDAFTLPGDVYAGKAGDLHSDDVVGRAANFAAFASPINPAVRSGARAIDGVGRAMTKQKVHPPSGAELKAAGKDAYKAIEQMGVNLRSDEVAKMAVSLQDDLAKAGLLDEIAPKALGIVKKLQNPPPDSVAPLTSIIAARRALQKAALDFNNPSESVAASRAIQALDGFIGGRGAETAVAGPAAAASNLYKSANANYAAGMRSGQIGGIEHAAELRAAAANSGQNLGNSLRQRTAGILLRPKEIAGYTDAEIKALEGVVQGSRAANTTRALGNLLGGGGGLGAAVTSGLGAAGGYAAGGPSMGVAGAMAGPIIGGLSKAASNKLTQRALNVVDKATRARSPLYQQMQAEAPMIAENAEPRAAIVRAMLGSALDADTKGNARAKPAGKDKAILDWIARELAAGKQVL